jgi:hypothetical protein
MKNIAIILGVTNYAQSDLALPACEYDVQIMQTILRASGQFEVNTLKSVDSELVKNELAAIIKRNSHEDIDQLLFYFSGHGIYQENNFSFLLRDYDENRPAQTSLSGKELDDLLRSLQPQLAIKIIDACQSGIPYIKSGMNFSSDTGNEMKSQFGNCYFMFSSDENQSSYATEKVSDFTLQFARSIVNANSAEVRYRHIAEYISDEFSKQKRQTPFFVSQGPLTEILGSFDIESKNLINGLLPRCEIEPTLSEDLANESITVDLQLPHPVPSLYELAQARAKNYASQEEAVMIVAQIKARLNSWELSGELADLYEVEKHFEDTYYNLPHGKPLGTWIDDRGYGYFAAPTYITEYYEVEASNHFGIGYTMDRFLPKQRSREVISGLQTSLNDMPFLTFRVTFKPKMLGLNRFTGWLTYVISRKDMQVFHNFIQNKEIAWDNFSIASTSNWQRTQFSLKHPQPALDFPTEFYSGLCDWIFLRVSNTLKASQS